jgi:hypothetical protein
MKNTSPGERWATPTGTEENKSIKRKTQKQLIGKEKLGEKYNDNYS